MRSPADRQTAPEVATEAAPDSAEDLDADPDIDAAATGMVMLLRLVLRAMKDDPRATRSNVEPANASVAPRTVAAGREIKSLVAGIALTVTCRGVRQQFAKTSPFLTIVEETSLFGRKVQLW
jgi:hypothetical protein